MPESARFTDVRDVIAFGDTHCGDQLALFPGEGFATENGMTVQPSELQRKIWSFWEEAWAWARERIGKRPFITLHTGDGIEGVHHNATTLVTWSIADQIKLGVAAIRPKLQDAVAHYHLRGTPAHSGTDGQFEEELAKSLGATPNPDGCYARKTLRKRVGGRLLQAEHKIGGAASGAYELGALNRLAASFVLECARRETPIPDILVRAHRHRGGYLPFTRKTEDMHVLVTPCWKAKCLHTHGIVGAQASVPEFGLAHIRVTEEDRIEIALWRKYVEEDEIE